VASDEPSGSLQTMKWWLGGHERAVAEATQRWDAGQCVRRLWQRDASLWTGQDEYKWLDWLEVLDRQPVDYAQHRADTAKLVAELGLRHALLLGMGGSSLCPEMLSRTFEHTPGFLPLIVLDSTVPAQIRAVEQQLDLARTLVIVSSKSGLTLETDLLAKYFYHQVAAAVGTAEAGDRFLAITDKDNPRNELKKMAAECRFRSTIYGVA